MPKTLRFLGALAAVLAGAGAALANTLSWDGVEISMRFVNVNPGQGVSYYVSTPILTGSSGTTAGLFNWNREQWFNSSGGATSDVGVASTVAANFDNDWIRGNPQIVAPGANFETFCIELNQYTDYNYRSYEVRTIDQGQLGGAVNLRPWQAAAIRELWAESALRWNGTQLVRVLDSSLAAAIQVGIWEIVYEYPQYEFDTMPVRASLNLDALIKGTGNNTGISFTPSGVASNANTLLGNVGLTGTYNIKTVAGDQTLQFQAADFSDIAFLSSTNQDQSFLLAQGPQPQGNPVPLPAATWPTLVTLGGLGVATLVRRRRRSEF